jgi:AcrR family transcriptional regulator
MSKGTKERILEAGIALWLENPKKVNATSIGKHIGLTHGAVLYHFPNGVKDAVAEYALLIRESRVIVQLIASNHPAVHGMSKADIRYHLNSLFV